MTDKERLENMSPIGFDLDGNVLLKGEDYHWLIEQAERVQELELEINGWREEVQKWQQFYKESEESHLETKELLKSIVNQNKRYREALLDVKETLNTSLSMDVESYESVEIIDKALEGEE